MPTAGAAVGSFLPNWEDRSCGKRDVTGREGSEGSRSLCSHGCDGRWRLPPVPTDTGGDTQEPSPPGGTCQQVLWALLKEPERDVIPGSPRSPRAWERPPGAAAPGSGSRASSKVARGGGRTQGISRGILPGCRSGRRRRRWRRPQHLPALLTLTGNAGNATGRAHKAPLRFGPSMAAGGRASPPQGPHCQSSMAGFDPALRTPFCREGRCRRHTTRAAQCSIPCFHDLTGRLGGFQLLPPPRVRELASSNVGSSQWGSEPSLAFRGHREV